jgi:peptide/nickel transport system ATP-binding protein
VEAGKILGVVGESGAGKSTVGNAVIGLLQEPGHIAGGEDLSARSADRRVALQEDASAAGPQDRHDLPGSADLPGSFANRESQLVETIRTHLPLSGKEAQQRAIELIDAVGIPDPAERIKQYPHQFSGGMRQRVVIALALCAEPELVIADEPTTALDVSIQAQILELMKKLCEERNVAMLVITHDMGVIADITDHVAVMYHGELVEYGETTQVLGAPKHPYTQEPDFRRSPAGYQGRAFPGGQLHREGRHAAKTYRHLHPLARQGPGL